MRGRLVNFVIVDAERPAVATMPARLTPVERRPILALPLMSEDEVKKALVAMLEEKGWTVTVAWGKARGAKLGHWGWRRLGAISRCDSGLRPHTYMEEVRHAIGVCKMVARGVPPTGQEIAH